VEISDFIDRVEEDKYLRVCLFDLIQFLENSANDELMHFSLAFCYFVVIFHTFKGDLFTQLLLHHFVDVKFNHIFHMFLVELHELFFHCGRAGDHVGSVIFSNFENFPQGSLFLLENVIDLVNGNELAVIEFQITPLGSVHERFWHGDNDISMFMSLLVHSAYFEVELF